MEFSWVLKIISTIRCIFKITSCNSYKKKLYFVSLHFLSRRPDNYKEKVNFLMFSILFAFRTIFYIMVTSTKTIAKSNYLFQKI